MKNYSSILKLLALVLSAVAVICLLVANLEAIADVLDDLCGKAKGKFCSRCSCLDDELEDWDDDEYEEWDS
jgi:hypothetical protein